MPSPVEGLKLTSCPPSGALGPTRTDTHPESHCFRSRRSWPWRIWCRPSSSTRVRSPWSGARSGPWFVGAGQRLMGSKAPTASGRLLVGSGQLGPHFIQCLIHRLHCPERGGTRLQGMKGWVALESQFRQPSPHPPSVRREV